MQMQVLYKATVRQEFNAKFNTAEIYWETLIRSPSPKNAETEI